jgi:hypothetical protein
VGTSARRAEAAVGFGTGPGGRHGGRRSPPEDDGPQPIALMNTPLGLGGDVLRRSFYVTGGGLQSSRSHASREPSPREPSPREHT